MRDFYDGRCKMMGKLRPMTALYLLKGNKILLLYRIGSRIADHSYVGCAGGHFQPEEYNDARACVLRELYEETGITADALQDLSLRYITMRLKNGEIRQNYYFFAKAKQLPDPLCSSEGTLAWFDLSEIDTLPMPVSAKQVLLHYRSCGQYDDLLRGAMTENGESRFVPLEEF